MTSTIKKIFKKLFKIKHSPTEVFFSYRYQRHNQKRLEHLASLGLNINGSSVLEVGAGIGDHTSFFIDRRCQIVSSDAKEKNLEILRSRYPNIEIRYIDMDDPDTTITDSFDIVYAYGLLYHLKKPDQAIKFMSGFCKKMLLLETCVSFGDGESINPCVERAEDLSQSKSGQGCRPTRKWVYSQLKRHFEFVYMPITQPSHEEFPIDWTSPPPTQTLMRSVFIASRQMLPNKALVEAIPMRQRRH